MPRFSVIVPCFNAEETIEATFASLLAQTVTDWEVIFVDDASSDKTPAILDRLLRSDPRVRLIRQPNAGPSVARNRAAEVARGEILAFLDADDIWLPTKLASVAAVFLSDPEADGVFGRIAFFRDIDAPDTTTSTVRPGRQVRDDVLGENPACTLSNLSVRRAAFLATGGFDGKMRHAEDLEWMNRALANGLTLVATEDLHVRYRASDFGLSADLNAMHTGWRSAVAPFARPEELRAAEARHLRYLARRALRIGQSPRIARNLALSGLRRAPLAFMGDAHRGPATLAACLVAPIIPSPLRRRAFS